MPQQTDMQQVYYNSLNFTGLNSTDLLTNELYFNMQRPDVKKLLEKMLELSEKHLQADKDLQADKGVVDLFMFHVLFFCLSCCEIFMLCC